MRIEDIQFFQLRKTRYKKFSKRLRTLYKELVDQKETIEEKRKRIKSIAEKINSKL